MTLSTTSPEHASAPGMLAALAYAVTLLAAAMLSRLTARSVLSAASMFLIVGFLAGRGVFHLTNIDTESDVVRGLAEIALVAVLFSDAMRGELLTEILKLTALFVFGALISSTLSRGVSISECVFMVLTLAVARPVALAIALVRSRLGWRERVTAAWFGPKAFASVVFALVVLHRAHGTAAERSAERLFHLVALVVAASILAHSSTDLLVARWLEGRSRVRA